MLGLGVSSPVLNVVHRRAGDCVGNVGLGRDPLELDEPSLVRRQRPERRDHAVDRAVLAVTLGQRRLAGGVVDEGNDGRRQFGAEGDEGDELRQDLSRKASQTTSVRPHGHGRPGRRS